MRPVNLADIEAGALVLMAVPAADRAAVARRLCARAAIADRHRIRTKAAHPRHGTGTLMSATQRYRTVPRHAADPSEFLFSLKIMVDALCACALDHPL